MFGLLIGVYPKSRTFQCLMFCQWPGAQEAGRSIVRTVDPNCPKGYSILRTACSWTGGAGKSCWSLLKDGLGISQQMVRWVLHFTSFSWHLFLCLLFITIIIIVVVNIIIIIMFLIVSIIKQLLFQCTSFSVFSCFSSLAGHGRAGQGGELGLSRDIYIHSKKCLHPSTFLTCYSNATDPLT